jgi:serine/threonine-protein kinase
VAARYRIIEPLGQGTRIFRAVTESSDGRDRQVAILRLAPNVSARFVPMVLDDMRPSLSLHHANIVEVLDIATTVEGEYFVVAEYIDGCDLKAFASLRKRVELPQLLHIVIDCCKGLAHAHSLGVIHRDVSPRAVLLGTEGKVKLMGFGLAKTESFESARFSYLSPEAARGLEVDHRADVFGAGIVLWELLAGRLLFLGKTDYRTVELIREARVPAVEDLDPALDTIVRKALARDAAARFQSATELGHALARYAISRGIELAPGETGKLVREVKLEVEHERSATAIDAAGLARVQDSVNRMVSIVDQDAGKPGRWN